MRRMTSVLNISKSISTVAASFRLTPRRVMSLALLMVLAFSFAFVGSQKRVYADDFSATVNYNNLKVHRSPSSGAPVFGTLPAGTVIQLIGRDAAAEWVEADTPVGDGWVWAAYVIISPNVMRSSLPITVDAVQPYARVIIYPQINIRSGPSVNYKVIGQLFHGDIVDVIGADPNFVWLEILLNDGSSGWIPAEYTYVRGNESSAPNTVGTVQPVVKAVKYLVPIHSAPDPTSPVIGSMSQNTYLSLIGFAHYHIWWEVSGAFGVGFVWNQNVLAVGDLSNLPDVTN